MNPNNPFGIITGPKGAEHSVSLNSTFREKIANTFRVLNGKLPFYADDNWAEKLKALIFDTKFETGLLDIVPFIYLENVFTFLYGAGIEEIEKNSQRSGISYAASFIFNTIPIFLFLIGLTAARFALRTATLALASALTAASIVAILPFVHLVTTLVRDSLLNTASEIPVTATEGNPELSKQELKDKLYSNNARVEISSTGLILKVVDNSDEVKTLANSLHTTFENIETEHNPAADGFNALKTLDFDNCAGHMDGQFDYPEEYPTRYQYI